MCILNENLPDIAFNFFKSSLVIEESNLKILDLNLQNEVSVRLPLRILHRYIHERVSLLFPMYRE